MFKFVARVSVLLLFVSPLVGFHGNRAEIYVLAADRMLAKGYSDVAFNYLGEAIAADPTYAKAYLKRGFLYLQKGKTDLALGDFSRMIELNPQDPVNYVTRGLAYSQSGDKEHAAADFRIGCDLGDSSACTLMKELQGAQP